MLSWLDYAPLHFRGASVTIPHKQNLLRFVEEQGGAIEPLAAKIGAANTLTVGEDGSLRASNTDYAALLDAVADAWGTDHAGLAGKRVAVLGAGGAARAAVAGFCHCDARVTVCNRTIARAQQLADEFSVAVQPLAEVDPWAYDLVINTTSVGMHPEVDASPVQFGPASPSPGVSIEDKVATEGGGPLVFDTVYNPAETRLLREAKAAGCATLGGREMFLRQGAAQFAGWTGLEPPLEVFREVLDQMG